MSNIHDFMQVRDKFEPDCVIGEGDTEPYLISIAISLKRIADAVAGDGDGPSLPVLLDRIEFNTREVM